MLFDKNSKTLKKNILDIKHTYFSQYNIFINEFNTQNNF